MDKSRFLEGWLIKKKAKDKVFSLDTRRWFRIQEVNVSTVCEPAKCTILLNIFIYNTRALI
jgi:hypothetical protein